MPARRRTFRLLAGAVSALALTLSLGTASASAAPAAGEKAATSVTSGWNNWSCKPSAAHPRPVVLLHGTLGNSWDNWLFLAPYLVKRGYCVFSMDYGQLPGVPLFNGLGPIEKSAGQLSAFVGKVRQSTGAGKVDLVGHSQGGGALPRYYLQFLGGADKVGRLVGMAPSHHGTTASGFDRLVDAVPGARKAIGKLAPAAEEQLAGSEFLKKLNANGDTVPGVAYTAIVTKYDEVVTPYKSQFFSGPNTRNVVLQDLCKWDVSEHAAIGTIDRIAFHEVANALDPEHATPTTCASALS
ncbi:alpha/beta fold hydrolase [Streptomyces sp. AV19]|uniref:esterase/lipase family protein n=1 Tax=Streptomyces sp. AV19 TaxID=2793068 RepID=UPI0018FEBB03|nr:alpha/beta fold hydrolase [Streptomyces sp. AV19]MBH1934459.1 alpha/beta fold hydrolase [Streptomyces sp. AV19]MDG4533250.1 alpha/beta fold hydrolase [Streptomyces sp. AV19]